MGKVSGNGEITNIGRELVCVGKMFNTKEYPKQNVNRLWQTVVNSVSKMSGQ